MPYDLSALRDTVRALLQNQGPDVLPDNQLDASLLTAKRRLDRDYPDVKSIRLNPSANSYYNLTTLITDWVPRFSAIKEIVNPAPDLASKEDIGFTAYGARQVFEDSGSWYMRFDETVASGRQLLVRYTVPWEIEGLEDATDTTVLDKIKNALEFICVSMACVAIANRMAGFTQRGIPAELIDWGGKERQYRNLAEKWEMLYHRELGLSGDKPKPVSVTRNYKPTLQDGRTYITHNRSL